MTKQDALITNILNELIEIKMHICNQRQFEGGIGLGGLINQLINLLGEDEEEDEDDDEEESDECSFDCIKEQLEERVEDLKDHKEEIKNLTKSLKESFCLLQGLYNNDHIFPQTREEIRQFLLRTEEFVDGCNGRIVTKNKSY